MNRNWRYGNLAKVHQNIGAKRNYKEPVLATCLNSYQDPATGFYRVTCTDVRRGVPYQGVQSITLVQPLPQSMGLLLWADGSGDLPLFLPLGY